MAGSTPVAWLTLRHRTPARIGLGRSGAALPTAAHLDFQRAHAQARDAVYGRLDVDRILAELDATGRDAISLHSAAADRRIYLRRPDLGRRLDPASRQRLEARPTAPAELLFVIADGLSANAVNTQAVALLDAVFERLPEKPPTLAPVVVVEGGRVAIGDEIGGLLGADLAVVLIGERPGLSAPNSLGIYVTWQPAPGTVDAARNCLSNIHAHGMSIPEAAAALLALIASARQHRITGIGLSQRRAQHSAELRPARPPASASRRL